jgi:hypothetical protein
VQQDKSQAAAAIAELAHVPHLRELIVNAGALPPLVSLLQHGCTYGQSHAARAIANLARPLCAQIRDAGALPLLIGLIRTANLDGRGYATFAAASLATDVVTNMHIIREGALPLLVNILCTGSNAAKREAADALAGLASWPLIVALIADDALPPLVALLDSGDDSGQASAARALIRLALDKPMRARIVDADALRPLIALLKSDSKRGKSNAVQALYVLGQDQPLLVRIIHAGAVPPLIALLLLESEGCARGESDARGLLNAVHATGLLAKESSAVRDIVNAGALPVLTSFLATPWSAARALYPIAMGGLFTIITYAKQGTLVTAGIAAVLAKAAKDNACPVAREADAALQTLFQQMSGQCMVVAQHDEICALRAGLCATNAARTALSTCVDSMASLAGPFGPGHDVSFRCKDGVLLGASRLLLMRASPYYRALLRSPTAEGASGVVDPDPDFSSAAHAALLGQLHAMGESLLPAELGLQLELLCLAAKLRSGDEGDDAVARVASRCEAAIRSTLDVDTCLNVLLRLRPYAPQSAELSGAALAMIGEHVELIVKQPSWVEFGAKYPDLALGCMQDVAITLSRKTAPPATRSAAEPARRRARLA